METRDLLIDTMKTLLWQRGYDATSPNQVLELSGVGKGSLYHHFKSKQELAIAAMDSRADEVIAEATQVFASSDKVLEKFKTYISMSRDGLAGCRLGRITQDPSIVENKDLQRPITRYFQALQTMMEQSLEEAKTSGELGSDIDATQVAITVIGMIQGGFVVSRANGKELMPSVNKGAITFLEALFEK